MGWDRTGRAWDSGTGCPGDSRNPDRTLYPSLPGVLGRVLLLPGLRHEEAQFLQPARGHGWRVDAMNAPTLKIICDSHGEAT